MLAKLTPSLVGLAGAIATAFAPQINAWVSTHAAAAGVIGAVAIIVANFTAQPHK